MKTNIAFFFLIFLFLAGCVEQSPEEFEKEVAEKVKYSYEVQNNYSIVACDLSISSYRDVYFHVYSTDNSTISLAIFDLDKLNIEIAKDKPGFLELSNAEFAIDDEGNDYSGSTPLSKGEYVVSNEIQIHGRPFTF